MRPATHDSAYTHAVPADAASAECSADGQIHLRPPRRANAPAAATQTARTSTVRESGLSSDSAPNEPAAAYADAPKNTPRRSSTRVLSSR